MSLKTRPNETVYSKKVRAAVSRAVASGELMCTVKQFAEWSGLKHTHNLRRRLQECADDLDIEIDQSVIHFGTQELVIIFPAYYDFVEPDTCPF